jgi:hypothetical protein
MTDPLLEALKGYGIFAIMAYLIVREVGPWLRDRVFPSYVEERKRRADAETVERERLRRLEERQIAALESMANVVKEIQIALVREDERMSMLLGGFAEHDRETREAITDMRQRTAVMDLNPPSRPRPRKASE